MQNTERNEPRDLTAALSSVEDDLAANWQRYRREAIGMDDAASGDLSDESAEAALDAFEDLIRTIVAMTQEPAHRTA